MRAELKGLPKELADIVAAHLVAAGQLIDTDPALAYRHAEAARRRAARLPLVREAAAETAYAAGLYEAALTQFRALRRMSGSPDLIPVTADCLRALGRLRPALELIEEGLREITDPAMRIEALIVQAALRRDLGQPAEAERLLRRLLDRPPSRSPEPALARAWYAYADLVAEAGREEEARQGFRQALSLDPEGLTDALDRLDAYDGIKLEIAPDDLDQEEDAGDRDSSEEPEGQDRVDDGTDLDDLADWSDWDDQDGSDDPDDRGDPSDQPDGSDYPDDSKIPDDAGVRDDSDGPEGRDDLGDPKEQAVSDGPDGSEDRDGPADPVEPVELTDLGQSEVSTDPNPANDI
jgi:tetratricopeptide (TPR) repeat protein